MDGKEGGKEGNGSDGPLQKRPGIDGFGKMVNPNNHQTICFNKPLALVPLL